MTLGAPDEYLSLIIKALDDQHTAGQVLNRADDKYREAANLFRTASERKGTARESGSAHCRQS
jgi:hypothetical protein